MQIKANANENQVIQVSRAALDRAAERSGKKAQKQGNRQSIFAGDIGLGMQRDPISLRKQQAQKKALKIIGDAWDGDRKVDQSIAEIKDKLSQLHAEYKDNLDIIAEGDAQKEALRQEYGVAPDSQEQKDLELLEKREDARNYPDKVKLTEEEQKRLAEIDGRKPSTAEDFELLAKKAESEQPGSGVTLTEEEQERLAQVEGQPLTDYQRRCLAIDKYQEIPEARNSQIEAMIKGYNASIRSIRGERLKHHEMVKAQKKADAVMEAAGREIVGMLVEEAKDHVDEELEETIEEAKKEAEEKAEEEEKIEERQEQQEELEERIDAFHEKNEQQEEIRKESEERAREDADLLEEMLETDMGNVGSTPDIKAEIKNMLHKMKLLEEDIKGTTVDDAF